MSSSSPSPAANLPQWTKFLVAALGGSLGWLPVHPFDVAKVRMQINESALRPTSATSTRLPAPSQSSPNLSKSITSSNTSKMPKIPNVASLSKAPSISSTLSSIARNEGFAGLYKGLSAAITRQLTYTTMRIGLYDTFRAKIVSYRNDAHRAHHSSRATGRGATFDAAAYDAAFGGKEQITWLDKLVCGLCAGGIAASVCNPVEVALVRMQADGAIKEAHLRRNYKNVFDAWLRVTHEEGFLTLYRGVRPTVARGMIVSCVQLGSYDQAKTLISDMSGIDGVPLHLGASVVSGYLYCLASLPLDICKTRMQNQRKIENVVTSQELEYRTIPQTLMRIVRNEGALALWKGFGPYFARGGGHTVCMFLCVEQIRKLVAKQYE